MSEVDPRVRCARGHAIPEGYESAHGEKPCPECGTKARVVSVRATTSLTGLFPRRDRASTGRSADWEATITVRCTDLHPQGPMLVDLLTKEGVVAEQIVAEDEDDVGLGVATVVAEHLRQCRGL